MKFLFLFITLFQLVLFLPTSSLPSSLFLEPLQPTTKLQPTNNIIPRNSLLKTINKETFSIDNSTPTPSKNTNASNAVSYEITTNNSTGESPSNEESVITNNASNISTTSTPTEGESGLIIQNSTNNESNTTIIETPQPKNSSQSKLKGESNNISNYTSNQESNEKEIEAPGTITEAHIDEVYKKGDAFLNRSSMEFIDPHGNRFDTVQYVRDLSPYAKEDIKDMNNPLKKDKALVGKPFYMENNITFDESPRIFHEIIETQINQVQTPITPISQYRLWKNFIGNKHFSEVSYNNPKRYPLNNIEEKKAVEIADPPKYIDPNHIVIPPKRTIDDNYNNQKERIKNLVHIRNPLKKQIYSMGYDHTFVRTDNEIVSELHDIADDVVQDIETYAIKKKRKNRN